MVYICAILYLAGMAPTWGMVQVGTLMSGERTAIGNFGGFMVCLLWPIIGLISLPRLFLPVK